MMKLVGKKRVSNRVSVEERKLKNLSIKQQCGNHEQEGLLRKENLKVGKSPKVQE